MLTVRSAALLILLSGCSLNTHPHSLRVGLSAPTKSASLAKSSRYALEDLSYSITLAKAGLTATYPFDVLQQRTPTCLNLNGRVSPFFSYEELVAGVSLTAESGGYTVSINAYHPKVTGQTLPQVIATTGAEVFLVGSTEFNTETGTSARISAADFLNGPSPLELRQACDTSLYTISTRTDSSSGYCQNDGTQPVSVWAYVIANLAECPDPASMLWGFRFQLVPGNSVQKQCPSNGFYSICCIAGGVVGTGQIPTSYLPNSLVVKGPCGVP